MAGLYRVLALFATERAALGPDNPRPAPSLRRFLSAVKLATLIPVNAIDTSLSTWLGHGCYTLPEAARLLGEPAATLRRWLGGYRSAGEPVPPLWSPQWERDERGLLLGFRDLMELRFVRAFLKAGVSLKTVRRCHTHAQQELGTERPFGTKKFMTDGRGIFLSSAADSAQALIDLRNHQLVLGKVIEQSFRDLDLAAGQVVRWRPHQGRRTILVDPTLSFGQPIGAASGVPTATLASAMRAEGSEDRVVRLFEVSRTELRDAVAFEAGLKKAA